MCADHLPPTRHIFQWFWLWMVCSMKHWVLEHIVLVHPPGTITGSILARLSSCSTLSKTWHLNESQASIHLVNENWPKTPLTQETISSSFIHPLIEDTTTFFKFIIQCFWLSLCTGKNYEWLQFGTIFLFSQTHWNFCFFMAGCFQSNRAFANVVDHGIRYHILP